MAHMSYRIYFFWSRDQHHRNPRHFSSTKPFITASLTNVHCTTQLFSKNPFFLVNQYNITSTAVTVMFIMWVQPLFCRVVCLVGPGVHKGSHVKEQHPGVLHHWLDLAQESDGLSSINQAMVVRQGNIHHGTDLHLKKRKSLRPNSHWTELAKITELMNFKLSLIVINTMIKKSSHILSFNICISVRMYSFTLVSVEIIGQAFYQKLQIYQLNYSLIY